MAAHVPESCPICACSSLQIEGPFSSATGDDILTFAVCTSCGHAIRTPLVDEAANLDIQQDCFESHLTQDALRRLRRGMRWLWLRKLFHRQSAVARQVYRMVGRRGKALDVGCSTGKWLATLGGDWDKHGVELSDVSARVARDLTGADVFCGDFADHHPPVEAFDLITAFAVIEHLVDPSSLTRWGYRHLRPGGVMIVMTGDRESVLGQRVGHRWPLYWVPSHQHFFSARSLEALLRAEGFGIIRREWRCSYACGETGLARAASRFRSFVRELLGFVTTPKAEHVYVYARKPDRHVETTGTIA